MRCTTIAKLAFSCKLSSDDEKMVREYAKTNRVCFEKAIWELYSQGEISIYDNHCKVDYDTTDIINVVEESPMKSTPRIGAIKTKDIGNKENIINGVRLGDKVKFESKCLGGTAEDTGIVIGISIVETNGSQRYCLFVDKDSKVASSLSNYSYKEVIKYKINSFNGVIYNKKILKNIFKDREEINVYWIYEYELKAINGLTV